MPNLHLSSDSQATRDVRAEALGALRFWEALEYLTPQAPPDIDLEKSVWKLRKADAELPWNDPVKQAVLTKQHGPRWRFQLFAGIVEGRHFVDTASQALGATPVADEERPPPKPAACVVVATDGAGMVTGQVFVSSLPWAMRCVLDGAGQDTPLAFSGFFGIGGVEEQLRREVADLMVQRRLLAPPLPPGAPPPQVKPELRPITVDDLDAMVELVFDGSGWRPEIQLPWRVWGMRAPKDDEKQPPDDPLNSFYAEDLERVAAAYATGDSGPGLLAYLRGEDGPERIDVERDVATMIDGVAPRHLPAGCWPATHPLVTAQQFAVNMAMRTLADDAGLFAVNGPPGTGKTTMLKDIVAAVVVRRADVLATFDYPVQAFAERLEIDNYGFKAYAPDSRLGGFGIVVASANNGAVENITKELPNVSEIGADVALDYFSCVADTIAAGPKATLRPAQRGCWGLIAAVLGSKEKRKDFVHRFWFVGTRKPATPEEQAIATNPLRLRSLQELFRIPEDTTNWQPEHGAQPWHMARENYRRARERVATLTARTERIVAAVRALHAATRAEQDARRALRLATHEQATLVAAERLAAAQEASALAAAGAVRQRLASIERRDAARGALAAASAALQEATLACPAGALDLAEAEQEAAGLALRHLRDAHERHLRHPPGFFAQLFKTERSRRWNTRDAQFDTDLRDAATRCEQAAASLARLRRAQTAFVRCRDTHAVLADSVARAEAEAREHGAGSDDSAAAAASALARLDQQAGNARAAHRAKAADRVAADGRLAASNAVIEESERQAAEARTALDAAGVETPLPAGWHLASGDRLTLHGGAPYYSRALFEARRELFVAAMALQQAFVADAWGKLQPTLAAFVNVINGSIHPSRVRGGMAALWDAFFLVVPVVSTTFASFPRVFGGIGREQLGWLLIDEAGQAAPQQAVGAIWRARRSIVVGDPLQLEPVVGLPQELVRPLLARTVAEQQWVPPATSVQTLADRANRYGTYLARQGSDVPVWLGAPLVVHRRCQDPMFTIANAIAYDNRMIHGVTPAAAAGASCWIHMPARDAQGHWSPAQGALALALVQQLTEGQLRHEDDRPRVYVITPFRTVWYRMRQLLMDAYGDAAKGIAGTVHTFQGKEADTVIFLLGGDPRRPGVITSFAGNKPNLVNVAVTRAKLNLYVIGDHAYWTSAYDQQHIYQQLARPLPLCQPDRWLVADGLLGTP